MIIPMVYVYWWNAGTFSEVLPESDAPALIKRLRDCGYYVWSQPAWLAA